MAQDSDAEYSHRSLPAVTSNRPPTREGSIDRVHARANAIKRRELETAFTKLEARGEVTDEQRAIIEGLADALVTELLESPTKRLRNDCITHSELQTAVELFVSCSPDEKQ